MERGEFAELDHTADLGLDLRGPSPGAVLEAAQRGLIQLLVGWTEDLGPTASRSVELSAATLPELLKAWCEELYRLLEERRFVALEARIVDPGPRTFRAELRGALVPPARLRAASELKGVTYHQLRFEAVDDGWRARVVFDV